MALLGKDELRKDFQYQLGSSSDNISFVGAKGITSQMEEYVAPAKDNLAKRWRTIASEVSVLTSSRSSESSKRDASTELERVGEGLYADLFNLTGGGPTAEDLLRRAFDKWWHKDRPLRIEAIGWVRDLPWELLRLPADVGPIDRPCWLGEVAIVSGARPTTNRSPRLIRSHGAPVVLSALGDEKSESDVPEAGDEILATARSGRAPLEYISVERRYLEGLPSTGRGYRCLGPLDHEDRATARKHLREHFGCDEPYHVIHFACHGDEATSEEDEFEAFVRSDQFRLTKADFNAQPRINFRHPNIAFLNMCNGLAPRQLPAGGMAAYFDRSTKSAAVVASAFEIDDRSAAAITEGLIDKILPQKSGRGTALGRALYDVRNELLARHRSLTGFCYRLLGDADLVVVRS